MIHSTETKEIFAAIVKAQAEMPTAPKDGNNPHFRSKYATLQSIAETAKPVLKKHGLAITQTFENACDGTQVTRHLRSCCTESASDLLMLSCTWQN